MATFTKGTAEMAQSRNMNICHICVHVSASNWRHGVLNEKLVMSFESNHGNIGLSANMLNASYFKLQQCAESDVQQYSLTDRLTDTATHPPTQISLV